MTRSTREDLWRRAKPWLQKHQAPLTIALFSFSALLLTLHLFYFSVSAHHSLDALLVRASADRQIEIPAGIEPRAGELPEPELAAGSAEETQHEWSTRTSLHSITWRTDENLRRAASLLWLQGEYDAGVEILFQGQSDRAPLAFASLADRETCQRAREALEDVLVLETGRFQSFWEELDPRDQEAYLGRGLDEQRKRVNLHLSNRYEWRDLARHRDHLPEKVLLCLVSNVHLELAARTKAPDAFLSVLLETGFPPNSLARETYVRSPPEKRREYGTP